MIENIIRDRIDPNTYCFNKLPEGNGWLIYHYNPFDRNKVFIITNLGITKSYKLPESPSWDYPIIAENGLFLDKKGDLTTERDHALTVNHLQICTIREFHISTISESTPILQALSGLDYGIVITKNKVYGTFPLKEKHDYAILSSDAATILVTKAYKDFTKLLILDNPLYD